MKFDAYGDKRMTLTGLEVNVAQSSLKGDPMYPHQARWLHLPSLVFRGACTATAVHRDLKPESSLSTQYS
jgi:hypothetical protein